MSRRLLALVFSPLSDAASRRIVVRQYALPSVAVTSGNTERIVSRASSNRPRYARNSALKVRP
jgi:hypothetical protein